MRPEIEAMAKLMEARLHREDSGNPQVWRKVPVRYHMAAIREAVAHLDTADDIPGTAVDIAVYAMMYAAAYGLLEVTP